MGKKLTADKIKALEENANILMEQGASQGDIDLMTSEFIEEFGVDDAMPEKKNEVQGLNVEVGTSVGSSVKSPVSSIKTEQNVGLSPSGKKGIDILRGASVKPISPTKTAIPQTPKKKKSKVEELRKSIQRKVAVGEPLTTDEVGEVREISSNAFLPLDGLKDGEVNVVLAGAQNKQNQQLISKSRNDQYQKQLKDRIVSGEVLPEDIKGMYDVSGFAPPDTDFEKLANDWNAENIKIKQKVDSEILNESSKLDEYIANLDNEIRGLESEQSRQAVQTRRTPKNAMDIEAQSATDGAIGNLKSIKYKAQQYLDYLSEKAIDSSKGEIIKRVNSIQGIRDERGLVKSTSELERVVDDYISTQPNEKRNLLLRKKPYLIESLIATEYIVPKANEDFYKKTNEIISDVPEGAKQLFKRITGEIDVKDGEEKYYDTQQQFAIANNAASLYFMDEIARTNQAFESVVSMPNVRAAIGGKLDVLKQQYDAGQISASDYKLKRLQELSLNPQTSAYAQEYVQKIKVAQDRYEAKIDKFLQSKVPDFAKFTEVDESGNIVSIAGMKPMEFTQKMTELQTAKEESLNEAAKSYSGEIEDRAVERREELFGNGVKSWVASNFAKGTHGLFEGMSRWAYDNTGFEFFDTARRGATESLYNSSVPFESQEVQGIMNVEAGDYAKAFNPLYMVGVASESAPYMLTTMGVGLATGGLAEGALLGMGLSEGIGAAISLSRAGRIAQKTIAAISSGTSDAYLNMTANYNDLIKEGYSKEQAKQIAFDAFKNELPVDILSGAVEMDALFSATSKPTIKNIIKGGASKAGSILIEEPIQEVYQGYSLEQAKGTNKSLSEYAFFDKEGFNNLMGGLAGGLGTGAVTNAMGIAKNALSWNRLYNVSTADMQNAVRYAGVTQMVSTPSEMYNSISLDILKSAQGIAQEKYQSIPNAQSSEKEKSRTEYINRTVAYEYGKALNVAIQNGTNIDDVHEHYKAHNEAISKAYGILASLANEKNKPMYQKQADYYASLAQKSEIGKQTPIYSLITPKGRIFITEQTAKTLAEGSIQQKNDAFNKAVRAGDIVGVQVVDDSQTAQSLIKKFDDAKLSQQLAVQQNQGGATAVGQPNQTNVQTPIEGTTEIPTTEGIVNEPNINPESAVATAPTQEQVEVAGLGTEAIGGEVATTSNQSETPTLENAVSGIMGNQGLSIIESDIRLNGKFVMRNPTERGIKQIKDNFELLKKQFPEKNFILDESDNKITISEQQPISTTQSEIEKKTKEISDLEERLKEPLLRPVIFEDDYSPSQLRDLKETWAKQDEEERIIIRKEIAQKQAELKELEQQPISTTQSEIEAKKADIKRRRQEELFNILSEEDKQIALKIPEGDKRNKWVKTRVTKTTKGNDAVERHNAEDALSTSTDIATRIAAKRKLESNQPFNSGSISDISKVIYKIKNDDILIGSEKLIKDYYDAELKALEKPTINAQQEEVKPTKSESNPALSDVNIVDSKSDDIISELNKLKTPQEKLNWLKEKGLITPIVINGKSYNSIDYSDRIMVLAKIGKYNIPFYISTGQAGKKNVKAGNWYVIFGIGESGWINKGSEELINKQYDFPIFQKLAKILNEGVGNFESRENNGNGKIIEGIGYLEDSKTSISDFNAQMNLPITPAKNNTDSKIFYENVNNVLNLVNDELKNVTQGKSESLLSKEQPISTTQSGSSPASSDVESTAKALEGLVNQIPTAELRRPNGSIGTQGFVPENLVDVARFIAKEMGFEIPAFNKDLGTSEIKQVIEYLKNNKEAQQKIKEYVVKDPVVVTKLPDNTYSIDDGNHRANLLNLIGVEEIPTISPNTDGQNRVADRVKEHTKAVESLLSKEQQPIEIDESTPFDLSIALQTKKEEQDAIQKQSTTEEVLLNERPEMGLQEVGEGNAQVEAVAEQGSQEEKIEVAPLSFTPKNFIEELIGVEGAVALSGINEEQRQELIKDRLRTTTLTPQKEKEREIVKLIKSHNGMRRNARERLDVRGRIMRLVNDYNKEYPNQKLTFKSWYGDVKVTRPSFDRKQKSTYQKDLTVSNLDVSNASLDETEKTFSERSDEFQRKFIELMDLGVQFEFRDAGNKKFSKKMLDDAMNDVDNGIPSRRAAVILNTVEKAIEENVITVGGSLTEGFQYIPLDLAIEETKLMNYEDELRNLSNAEIVALYENEILAQKELDNIIQQEYETEYQSDPNDEFGNVKQLAPRKTREVIAPNQEGNNQGQAVEGTIEENQNVNNETPKTTTNREAGENLVGGNQADIPTDADGNGQREEEITKDTPKQGEEGVGVVAGAPTPAISEMDRAVLDAMKPTFEIEFIPNAKFLNTSAPLENKSSQDAVKRRYQTIKKLLECL
jgi:hypothetical protein